MYSFFWAHMYHSFPRFVVPEICIQSIVLSIDADEFHSCDFYGFCCKNSEKYINISKMIDNV